MNLFVILLREKEGFVNDVLGVGRMNRKGQGIHKSLNRAVHGVWGEGVDSTEFRGRDVHDEDRLGKT